MDAAGTSGSNAHPVMRMLFSPPSQKSKQNFGLLPAHAEAVVMMARNSIMALIVRFIIIAFKLNNKYYIQMDSLLPCHLVYDGGDVGHVDIVVAVHVGLVFVLERFSGHDVDNGGDVGHVDAAVAVHVARSFLLRHVV